jgi:hypothetical protein
MAGESQKIIQFVADFQSALAGLKSFEAQSVASAKNIQNSFNQNLKTVGTPKVSGSKTDDVVGKYKDLANTTTKFSSTVADADGNLKKLDTTVKFNSKGVGKLKSAWSDLGKNMNKAGVAQSSLIGKSSQLGTNLNSVASINQRFSSQLKNVGNASTVVARSLPQVSGNMTKLGTVVKTTDGKFLRLQEVITRTPQGIQKVQRSVKDVTKAYSGYSSGAKNAGKNTVSLTENITRLAKRAALTIPLWLILRGAVMGFIKTIKNGFRDISKFDEALQKLRRNIQGTPEEITASFASAKSEITDFSIKTGKSVEEITKAIQRFATVGFDIEVAMKAGFDATRLAILEFGDGEQTANAFARSLRVLTEGMTDSNEISETITKALAKTDQLWKTNAFEIDEFTSNLEKFAGTAKIANLSIDDTLSLLATLSTGGLGNRAGRLLRSTLLRALGDVENITRTLNLDFDPNNQPTIVFIQELIKSLRGMKTVENVPTELSETLGELFSVRSTEVLGALTALEKTLKSNLAVTGDVNRFNKEFENQLKTIQSLTKQYHNLNREIGKAFVTGIVGGDDYQKTLVKIVGIQRSLLSQAEKFGGIFRDAFLIGGVGSIAVFYKQYLKFLTLFTNPVFLTITASLVIANVRQTSKQLADQVEEQNKEFNEIGKNIGNQINQGLKGKLSATDLKDLLITLETFGSQGLKFDNSTYDRLVEQLKIALELQKEIETTIENQTKATDKQETSLKRRNQLANFLIESELEILKARGATESQLLINEKAIRKHFGIEKEIDDQIKDQLATQRAITEERKLQNSLGSDSLKLFKIAQENGVEVAKTIGDVLAGNVDFGTFVRRGGEELEIFKKQFGDVFEQQQAQRFFEGLRVPELENLRGGSSIAIEERIKSPTIGALDVQLSRLEALDKKLNQPKESKPLDNNTNAVIDLTKRLEELTNFYKSGGILGGRSASDLVNLTGQNLPLRTTLTGTNSSVTTGKQVIDLNVNIDGKNLSFRGTPETIQQLASASGKEVEAIVLKALKSQEGKKVLDEQISQF